MLNNTTYKAIIDANVKCLSWSSNQVMTDICLLGGGDSGHEHHQGHQNRKIRQTTQGLCVCVCVGKKLPPPAADNFAL